MSPYRTPGERYNPTPEKTRWEMPKTWSLWVHGLALVALTYATAWMHGNGVAEWSFPLNAMVSAFLGMTLISRLAEYQANR